MPHACKGHLLHLELLHHALASEYSHAARGQALPCQSARFTLSGTVAPCAIFVSTLGNRARVRIEQPTFGSANTMTAAGNCVEPFLLHFVNELVMKILALCHPHCPTKPVAAPVVHGNKSFLLGVQAMLSSLLKSKLLVKSNVRTARLCFCLRSPVTAGGFDEQKIRQVVISLIRHCAQHIRREFAATAGSKTNTQEAGQTVARFLDTCKGVPT